MKYSSLLLIISVLLACSLRAQPPVTSISDSVVIRLHPAYNDVSKFHKRLFGENYRKEWAAAVKLPVIQLSQINGGLTVLKRGGGMQTLSLRLEDKSGKEWVLRSLEKNPEVILPPELRQTFARDWLQDAMSAQHPFAALIIPVIANAVNVPHATPLIGVVAADTTLGRHAPLFANKANLLEEREPLGNSDNTAELLEDLNSDNDNSYDARLFIRARLLDLLLSDWDRHADQWRWVDTLKGKGKFYVAVPRDRDQALYVNEGLFPSLAARPGVVPTLQGLDKKIKHVKYSLFKSNFLNPYPASHVSYEEWMAITHAFVNAVTDSVLEAALLRLPPEIYQIRHQQLLQTLKSRRQHIPEAMSDFYRFINRVVDVRVSDKHEWVDISSTDNKALKVTVLKKSKEGAVGDTLMAHLFLPAVTKELRLFLANGWDSVTINNATSPISIRIVGGQGHKAYHVLQSKKKIKLYGRTDNSSFTGQQSRLKKHLSNDSLNTAIVPTNPYHLTVPLITGGYNIDDGVLLGIVIRQEHQGFRKTPYGSSHRLTIIHALLTNAYQFRYQGEWMQALGKADITLYSIINGPNNTVNFFGRGNETKYERGDNSLSYYRVRFPSFQLEPAVRFRNNKGRSLSIGPSFQYYNYDSDENKDKFIENTKLYYSYDSATLEERKAHLGLFVQLMYDRRNKRVLPTSGFFSGIRVHGFAGLNEFSESFMQIIPEVGFYQSLNRKSTLVVANRLSGGITIGKTAFYQSLFLGGNGNLLGYRKYRFAGQHRLSNNLELHLKLADIKGYLLPGQLGLMGFYDVGRVWENDEDSKKWHQGVGGGFYFAPAQMVVITALAAYSQEGLYPQVNLGFRF